MYKKLVFTFVAALIIAGCALFAVADPFVLNPLAGTTPQTTVGVVNSNGVILNFTAQATDIWPNGNLTNAALWAGGIFGGAVYDSLIQRVTINSATIDGNGAGLTNLVLKVASTNGVAPGDTSTIKAWVNVTLTNGAVFKMPLYQ